MNELDQQMRNAIDFDSNLEDRMNRDCAYCNHSKQDHSTARDPHDHYKSKAGDEHPIKVPTFNRKAFCHVALCDCCEFL
jgi:hypothetical protein